MKFSEDCQKSVHEIFAKSSRNVRSNPVLQIFTKFVPNTENCNSLVLLKLELEMEFHSPRKLRTNQKITRCACPGRQNISEWRKRGTARNKTTKGFWFVARAINGDFRSMSNDLVEIIVDQHPGWLRFIGSRRAGPSSRQDSDPAAPFSSPFSIRFLPGCTSFHRRDTTSCFLSSAFHFFHPRHLPPFPSTISISVFGGFFCTSHGPIYSRIFKFVLVFGTILRVPENCDENCSISRSNSRIMERWDCGLVLLWFRRSQETCSKSFVAILQTSIWNHSSYCILIVLL